jgi:hypothetical protein
MGLFPVREKMGIIISHAILKVGINQRLLKWLYASSCWKAVITAPVLIAAILGSTTSSSAWRDNNSAEA